MKYSNLKWCYHNKAWTINPSLSIWNKSAVRLLPSQRQAHFTSAALAARFAPNDSLALSKYKIFFHSWDNQLLWIYIIQWNNNTLDPVQHMCFLSKRSWETSRELDLTAKIGRQNKQICGRVSGSIKTRVKWDSSDYQNLNLMQTKGRKVDVRFRTVVPGFISKLMLSLETCLLTLYLKWSPQQN